jgi:hypothetical protein
VLLHLGVLTLLAAGLTGCSSDTEDYCGTLRQDQPRLQRLADRTTSAAVITDTLAVLEELRQQAPADIRDEWDTVVFAWRGLESALQDTDVDIAHFDPAHRPDGVSSGDFARVTGAAENLRSAPVADAAQGIEQQANDICQVDLGL